MEAIHTLPSVPTQERYISADEFLEIANSPLYANCLVELIEGEIVTVPFTNRQHSEILSLVTAKMVDFVYSNKLGRVYSGDGGFLLERSVIGKDTLRGIDIAYMSAANAPDPNVPSVIEGSPDLAIEIVSPSNAVEDIELKVNQLFRAGTRVIWIVIPGSRSVHVRTADSSSVLRESDTLTGGDILPGFEVKVADIFPW